MNKTRRNLASFVAVNLGLIWLSGCALNSPTITETTRSGTNGTETARVLRVRSWALWPATADIATQKATLGKTFSVGTTGEHLDSGGTNVTETLVQLNRLLGK
ncbi:MAG: hypothetical protein DVB31_05455 [Verrucomicrobia bacterium]|nr:MAG: hypothetical protein DVB31_05455 [Verrucomicrobiota bacterium]